MALRNAFDGLATEGGLRRIANLLTFARDSADRIRVAVDTGSVTANPPSATGIIVYNQNSSTASASNITTTHFSASSWNVNDSRQNQRDLLQMSAELTKTNRWTF